MGQVSLSTIKAWGIELGIHPDVLSWVVEIYAKSDDDDVVIDVIRRVSEAQSTRAKNLARTDHRKTIEWDANDPRSEEQ